MSTPCPFCNGDGWHAETEHNPACAGDGEHCVDPCPVQVQVKCGHCEGSGYADDAEGR